MTDPRSRIARVLLTLTALILALVPPLADFGPSHVTNPSWPPHARLHTVWLVCTNSMVALLALALLWRRDHSRDPRTIPRSAALLTTVLAGFFLAAASQTLYNGALTDENGVAIRFGPVDANLATFSVCATAVIIALVLHRRAVAQQGAAAGAS